MNSVDLLTRGWADGADDGSAGCRVGEVERWILHIEHPDVDGHLRLTVGRSQAVKQTWSHLLNSAGFTANRHAGVPWSEAVSCEGESGSSRHAALIGAQDGLGQAAQGDLPRCEAFAPHNHFDRVVSCRQSAYRRCDVTIGHRGYLQLCGADKNGHIIHLAAKP